MPQDKVEQGTNTHSICHNQKNIFYIDESLFADFVIGYSRSAQGEIPIFLLKIFENWAGS